MTTKATQTARAKFFLESRVKAFDLRHRATIHFNMTRYDDAFAVGKQQFRNLDMARKRAALRKHYVIENLEDHLKTFEYHFTARGGKIIWAQDVAEARKAILGIFEENHVKQVVKSKSMVTEEAGITTFLEKNGVECFETDLGEYIVQISNDKPYHIVTPAMHLSADDVAKIFHNRFDLPRDSSPDEITKFVRQTLREKFASVQAGITGANFLISESGAVALTENEGNALLSMSVSGIHIVITGIEKIIPTMRDLDLFWPLLATHGTGQHLTAYNSLVFGPKKPGENDGPEKMYVILLDNGRSRLLKATPQRRNLACIRCGACLNACPVYRNIGGHTYGTIYSGPIGAVITPHLSGEFETYKHLSFATSLCGKCTEVCPVGIDLHHQLLYNRNLSQKMGLFSRSEKMSIKAYKWAMKKRKRLDMPPPWIKNFFATQFLKKGWGENRTMPRVVKSFSAQWKEKQQQTGGK